MDVRQSEVLDGSNVSDVLTMRECNVISWLRLAWFRALPRCIGVNGRLGSEGACSRSGVAVIDVVVSLLSRPDVQ